MRTSSALALVYFFLLGSSPLGGQEVRTASSITFGHSIEIPSRHLDETRQVSIRLPHSYTDEEGGGAAHYPVLYLLDGGDYFEPFAGLVQFLTMYEMVPHGDRMSELTYSPSNEENGNWPTSGGADSFHRFLAEELIPTIDESYRTQPFRMLVGHSLGGLFAVESLTRHPGPFQTTIAISPSLYWNQFEWLENASALFDGVSEWRHFLFISGELKGEEETRRLADFKSLADTQAPDGFEYRYSFYPQESHASVAIPALYQTLKQLFEGWPPEGEAWALGPDSVQAHFQGLTDRFGFPVPIPEEYLIGHALHGLQRHDAPDEAILLLELCLSLYPGSADTHAALGQAYESKGDRDEAVGQYRRALELDPEHEVALVRLQNLRGDR
jgi:predicted alpha/beta superfamily hydrolase